MTAYTVVVRGIQELSDRLLLMDHQIPGVLKAAIRAEAEVVMREAKRLCPTGVSGALRASGFVSPVQGTRTDMSVTMGFGGPAAPYAAAMHEGAVEHFPPSSALERWVRRVLHVAPKDVKGVAFIVARAISKRGSPLDKGKTKFLERPYLEHTNGLIDRLVKGCDQVLAVRAAKAAAAQTSEFVGAGGGGSL